MTKISKASMEDRSNQLTEFLESIEQVIKIQRGFYDLVAERLNETELKRAKGERLTMVDIFPFAGSMIIDSDIKEIIESPKLNSLEALYIKKLLLGFDATASSEKEKKMAKDDYKDRMSEEAKNKLVNGATNYNSFNIPSSLAPLVTVHDASYLGFGVDKKEDKGTKHDQGKAQVSMVPKAALEQVAAVMAFGANKYGKNNWKQGLAYSRLVDAAMRHILAFNEKEDVDPESKMTHLAHAATNLFFLMYYESKEKLKQQFDDRG